MSTKSESISKELVKPEPECDHHWITSGGTGNPVYHCRSCLRVFDESFFTEDFIEYYKAEYDTAPMSGDISEFLLFTDRAEKELENHGNCEKCGSNAWWDEIKCSKCGHSELNTNVQIPIDLGSIREIDQAVANSQKPKYDLTHGEPKEGGELRKVSIGDVGELARTSARKTSDALRAEKKIATIEKAFKKLKTPFSVRSPEQNLFFFKAGFELSEAVENKSGLEMVEKRKDEPESKESGAIEKLSQARQNESHAATHYQIIETINALIDEIKALRYLVNCHIKAEDRLDRLTIENRFNALEKSHSEISIHHDTRIEALEKEGRDE